MLLFVGAILMASQDPRMSEEGTANKRNHVASTIP
jgi:hypothetical protein